MTTNLVPGRTWTERVDYVIEHHKPLIEAAANEMRAVGFTMSQVTLRRLAFRISENGLDAHRAAIREIVYRIGRALDPVYLCATTCDMSSIGLDGVAS